MNRKEFGRLGEDTAADYLVKEGYTIAARNYRCRLGELDIVAKKGRETVFVEVKTRSSLDFGMPSEAVGRDKRRHLRNTAAQYMVSHDGGGDCTFRIDIIEVLINGEGKFIRHIVNAVQES